MGPRLWHPAPDKENGSCEAKKNQAMEPSLEASRFQIYANSQLPWSFSQAPDLKHGQPRRGFGLAMRAGKKESSGGDGFWKEWDKGGMVGPPCPLRYSTLLLATIGRL